MVVLICCVMKKRVTIVLRYMSQVTYGILRICRVGFLRISERRSVDVRESSAESSLSIRGTSVGHPRNVLLKVCVEHSKEI